QRFIRFAGAALAGAAHGQLHREHRYAHADQKQQVKHDEQPAAALARKGWEPPDIADADGAPRADQDEPQARGKGISFLHKNSSLLGYTMHKYTPEPSGRQDKNRAFSQNFAKIPRLDSPPWPAL